MKDNTAAVHAQVPVDVATFLLNEKRVDLQLVEARHRVSVMLIPNMHLETPNYSVTRLRHDDLNQSEPLPPSYDLVEMPAEEEGQPAAVQETAAPRQQAAVQGITPQQPAPVAVKPEPAPSVPAHDASIIDKIVGWFKRKPEQGTGEAPARPPAHGIQHARRDGGQRERIRHERGSGERPSRAEVSGPQQRPGRGERGQRRRDGEPAYPEGRRPEFRRHDGAQQQKQ